MRLGQIGGRMTSRRGHGKVGVASLSTTRLRSYDGGGQSGGLPCGYAYWRLPSSWHLAQPAGAADVEIRSFPLPKGSGPHDVAVSADGIVWYTAQRTGKLGRLDPETGKVDEIALGSSSAPHGVIIGPDGAPWITDGGLNAIVRVDPASRAVKVFKLPEARGYVNLNTAAFDGKGGLWFTGQNGVYGWLDPKSGEMTVYDAPRGRGAYGITATPDGAIYYASLAGSHIARIDIATGKATVIEPPTPDQGARRIWSDSKDNSGSANGIPVRSAATIPPRIHGRHGSCRASGRKPMPSMSTTRTRCGSPIFAPTPWSASIR